jgi:putative transposase
MSYVANWLHCVWGTKKRIPFMTENLLPVIVDHIKNNADDKGIYIDAINGYNDHIHCLISLNPDQTLSQVIKLIKGESSFWINSQKLTKKKFQWAVEYFAISLSQSHIERVRKYIRNQQGHHSIKTWEDEYFELLNKYGFERFSG